MNFLLKAAVLTGLTLIANAATFVDLGPGTFAPPGSLGGYAMSAFPKDVSPEGTLVTQLTPPPGFGGSGDLMFDSEVEHMTAGSIWDTWSHGYTGDVYFNADHELLMTLPADTLAFYLYLQPNLKSTFEFEVNSGVTAASLAIDGDAGARFVGFWTDDPMTPLTSVYIQQVTQDSDGFAVGEFSINAWATVPETGPTFRLFAVLVGGLLMQRQVLRARHTRA